MGTPKRMPVDKLLKMLDCENLPLDDDAVKMDCNDCCEDIADLAERVANGEKLEDIHPKFAAHLELIQCSKEEFYALVSVIRADRDAEAPANG